MQSLTYLSSRTQCIISSHIIFHVISIFTRIFLLHAIKRNDCDTFFISITSFHFFHGRHTTRWIPSLFNCSSQPCLTVSWMNNNSYDEIFFDWHTYNKAMDSKLGLSTKTAKMFNAPLRSNRFAIVDQIFRDTVGKTPWTRYFATQRNIHAMRDSCVSLQNEIFRNTILLVKHHGRDISRRNSRNTRNKLRDANA